MCIRDRGSTDKTVSLAKKFNCKIVEDTHESFAHRRNTALKHAKHPWIVFIDADERVSSELRTEILESIKNTTAVSAFYIPRIDIFWGKQVRYGEVLKARTQGIIRLVKADSGIWKGHVHEVFVPEGRTSRLTHHLTHYSHTGIADFLASINMFSTLRAQEMYKGCLLYTSRCV